MSERIVILGGGESGIGAALLASVKGHEVFLSDASMISLDRKYILEANEIDFEEGGHTKEKILNANRVVKSPGIPDSASLVQELNSLEIPVISEIEFAYNYLPEGSKVVAITGTNGKTTTTLLTYHLLKDAGLDVAIGGNVGTSLAGLIAQGSHAYYVVEVSSFQLDGTRDFKPDVAVLLNITPDHLDRYDNDFGQYVNSKFKIVENLTQDECFIYCHDSEPITEELGQRKLEACLFAISASKHERLQAYLEEDHIIFNYQYKEFSGNHRVPLADISLIGKHNMVNTMAAVLSALFMGVPIEKITIGLRTFENAPHRLELIADINGVGFINDSKATNVDAVYYALDGVRSKIVWIVGGVDKGNDYSSLMELIKEKVKAIVCLGLDNGKLRTSFGQLDIPLVETANVDRATEEAYKLAESGDVVLLSPACASFDLFKNYMDRGDKFRQAVNDLSMRTKEKV